VTVPFRLLACALLAAAALVVGAARPVTAAAATPCWKTLLTDWYDGRIDNTYPLHCYTDAIHHLPADVQTYSSAHDDILRALQSAKAKLQHSGKKVTSTTPLPGGGGGGGGGGGKPPKGGGTTTTGGTTSTTTTTGATSPGRHSGKGLGHLADKLNPSSPSSLPLPLLVLGALAILLVAAGGAGIIAKRLQGRRQGP
jgi:hypothetical protein